MKTLKLAVIGKDVSKSQSPQIHNFIAQKTGNKISYERISIAEDRFENEIEKLLGTYDGFNVTIPYKLSVIPHLNEIVGDAKTFGAVNTVCPHSRKGYNTDGLGFMLMLEVEGVDVKDKTVLLLGAGGAGRSVAKKLSDGGARVFIYDKNYQNAKAVADEFDGITVLENLDNKPYYAIINATGVGMHKTEGISPIGADLINLCEVAVDLIYVPPVSKFLEIANGLGKKIVNGEQMLFYQAYYSQCIYFGKNADAKQAKILYTQYKEEL
ncbi:MAG: shikimate dehydrogenase [Clostridia bacterium]|nr:shikimate dehydrogenase [Clostridia bacterium]